MTAVRDLDRQLAGWLDERATSITPDGLLARSLARVDATRQRPRWVVGDRLPSGSAWGRAVVPAWAILLFILLAAVAVVATGARLFLLPVPATIVDASPSPFAADMSIAPSAGPTVFPTPDNAVAPQPGMFASLADFLAASDTVAWARTEVPGAIYRSANTGRTWTEVRSGTWNGTTGATAFIDAQTMYAASDGPQATIAATHDGGATWVETTLDLPSTDTGPVFSFESSSSGFATFFDTAPGSPLRVYGTTDGGLTWTGPKNGTVPHMAASSDKLEPPIGGFLWQSAGKPDNKPFDNRFFLSADGGATWPQ